MDGDAAFELMLDPSFRRGSGRAWSRRSDRFDFGELITAAMATLEGQHSSCKR
jgi:hypothetical protein